jgi:transcriptional regulator with XRE-family HTH domain
MNESTILQNIRKIRGLKNYRPEFIAQELDLSARAYSKIETGETALTFNRFFRIANILEIKPEELMGFDYKSIFTNCEKSGNNNIYNFEQNTIKELLKSKDDQIQLLKDIIEDLKK